jgi:DNA-binding transcriptional regulator GbsR (MarR family)
LELFKKNKTRWYGINDIIKKLNISKSAVSHSLTVLRKSFFVDYKVGNQCNSFLYKYKKDSGDIDWSFIQAKYRKEGDTD